jgi:hypothetical protein
MTRNFFKKGLIKAIVALFVCMVSVAGMHNGLGLTPPMGWNTWNRLHHEQIDVNDFVDMRANLLKYDYCFNGTAGDIIPTWGSVKYNFEMN